jgi:nicotinate-nucleotide--dimethylbenzimidazole phosphoribosyltransferase
MVRRRREDAEALVSARDEAQRRYDSKTKPRGSLGRLEELGCRIAEIRGFVPSSLRSVIVIAAGDHGVARETVSAYPSDVTAQMVANFEAGGAAVNVLARLAGAELRVVDTGVGAGTANMLETPAMTADEVAQRLHDGEALAEELDADVVALGEMGIGNTTAASALTSALLGLDAELVCGRGTGIDDDGLARKVDVVRRAVALHVDADPLAALGGFEIAFLAGLAIGCARRDIVVLLDGFITSAAALAAVRTEPAVRDVLIASHRSPEPGHAYILDELGLEPLLDLGLRLGEGSGAALALPLLQASIAILAEMATFEEAGVSDSGR